MENPTHAAIARLLRLQRFAFRL